MMGPKFTLNPATHSLEHVLASDPAVVRGFAHGVYEALATSPLSLHARDRLLKRAVRLGIKRFDANLIIAAMEQRRRERPMMRMTTDHDHPTPARQHSPARWLPWATAVCVQATISVGAWWLLFA
ncbi:MAG: hypothetical protein H7144_02400 [Burkholderiales bacterium]|nr:hypothetical protein [Phycisphaerae bacterium]